MPRKFLRYFRVTLRDKFGQAAYIYSFRSLCNLRPHLMEKKEFLKKESVAAKASGPKESGGRVAAKSRLSAITGGTFGVIKFVLGICLLPFVYSSTISFFSQFNTLRPDFQSSFYSGIITFAVVYLFVFEPVIIYTKGQKMLEVAFSFFAPLVKVAPYVLPIYTIIVFLVYLLSSIWITSDDLTHYTLFFLGLPHILHLTFGAKTLRSKQGDWLKANYIFGFSFIYIVNLIIVALCFNVMFKEYSFVGFFNSAFITAGDIFSAVFKQLFIPK